MLKQDNIPVTLNIPDTATVGPKVHLGHLVQVTDHAQVIGEAVLNSRSTVEQYGSVTGQARMYSSAKVTDWGRLSGSARMYQHTVLAGNARIVDAASATGTAHIYGDAYVGGTTVVIDNARVHGNAQLRAGTVGFDADVFRTNHVIVLAGLTDDIVTIYRISDGSPRIQAGCQNFYLDEDLDAIVRHEEVDGPIHLYGLASEHGWDLPDGYEAILKSLLAQTKGWKDDQPDD